MILKIKILPRWLIFLINHLVTILVFVSINLIFYKLNLSFYTTFFILKNVAILMLVNMIICYLFQTYSGIVRYTGSQDAIRLFKSSTLTLLILFLLNELALQTKITDMVAKMKMMVPEFVSQNSEFEVLDNETV